MLFVSQQKLISSKGCLPLKIALYPRFYSIQTQTQLPSKVVFPERLSFIEGCLTWKVVLH